jgi:hypothetical protein
LCSPRYNESFVTVKPLPAVTSSSAAHTESCSSSSLLICLLQSLSLILYRVLGLDDDDDDVVTGKIQNLTCTGFAHKGFSFAHKVSQKPV